jgi:hypothetical protein
MPENTTGSHIGGVPARADHLTATAALSELSLPRLYALRAAYLFISVGLGVYIWPSVISHTNELATNQGARFALLAGLGATAALGLRYPVKMLPLLLFELTWKATYLAAFALPLWSAHQISEATAQNINDVAWGSAIISLLIPWRYVFAQYVLSNGDRWK